MKGWHTFFWVLKVSLTTTFWADVSRPHHVAIYYPYGYGSQLFDVSAIYTFETIHCLITKEALKIGPAVVMEAVVLTASQSARGN